jgi:hypothetical protein
VHRVMEGRLAEVNERAEVATAVRHSAGGLLISSCVGLATMSLTEPLGVLAAASAGSAIGGVLDIKQAIRRRRQNKWVGALARLNEVSSARR